MKRRINDFLKFIFHFPLGVAVIFAVFAMFGYIMIRNIYREMRYGVMGYDKAVDWAITILLGIVIIVSVAVWIVEKLSNKKK